MPSLPEHFWSAPEWRHFLKAGGILAAMLVLEWWLIARIRRKVRSSPALPHPELPWTFRDLAVSTLVALPFMGLGLGLTLQEMLAWERMDPAGMLGMLTHVDTLRLALGSTAATELAAGAAVLWLGLRRHRLAWSEFGLWFPGAWAGLAAPLLAIAAFLAAEQAYEMGVNAAGYAFEPQYLVALLRTAVSPLDRLFVMLTAGILIPFLEELVFRCFLFVLFKRYLGAAWAAAITSFLFAVAHIEPVPGWDGCVQNLLRLPIFMAMGLMFTALFHRTGSLLPSFLAHAANNLLQLALVLGTAP